MKETIVIDSTCLIGLERIGKLDILPALFEPILIPDEIFNEFGTKFSWLHIETPTNFALINALQLLIDAGEAEAIALALEKDCKIISDDKQARLVAKTLGLKVIGTIGTLIQAKQDGLINLLKPILDDLETNGFHLGENLKKEALKIAGE